MIGLASPSPKGVRAANVEGFRANYWRGNLPGVIVDARISSSARNHPGEGADRASSKERFLWDRRPLSVAYPCALLAANVVQGVVSGSVWPFVGALVVLACAACGLYTSRRGKFVAWAELLDQLNLRGDERILDLGCGRGAVLLLAAQRLTTGRAVGVDLWRRGDQSGNAAEATRRNALAEGVADRVELHTADMTALPFDADSFDLVVSNVAIHNIKDSVGREKALEEAVRVLRRGGRLMIADLWATRAY